MNEPELGAIVSGPFDVELDHVHLAMSPGKEQLSSLFHCELLGLTELAKPEPLADRGDIWVVLGDPQLHLRVETEFHPARKDHPALSVNSLDALSDRLQDGGCEVRQDDALPQVRRFYADDPFGNRVEIL